MLISVHTCQREEHAAGPLACPAPSSSMPASWPSWQAGQAKAGWAGMEGWKLEGPGGQGRLGRPEEARTKNEGRLLLFI